jgi:hypothetical protein
VRERVRAALARFEEEGPSPDLVEALAYEAGDRALIDGDLTGALEVANQALEIAESLGLPRPVRALGYRGIARLDAGDVEGLDDLREAVALAQEQGLGRERLRNLCNLALFQMRTNGAQALQLNREGLAQAELMGNDEYVLAFRAQTVYGLDITGNWDEAMTLSDHLASDLEAHDAFRDLAYLRVTQAMMTTSRGDPGAARPLTLWTLEHARRTGEQSLLVSALVVAMHVAFRLGDGSMAREMLSELLGDELRAEPALASWAEEVAEAAVGLGMIEHVREILAKMTPHWPEDRASVAAARAILAEDDGDHGTAVRLFREATEIAEQLGHVPMRARSLLGLGRCSLAAGDKAAGVPALEESKMLAEAIGARGWLPEIEDLLERMRRDAS